MSVAIMPADFLKHHFDPLSQQIDSFGGPHVLLGCIASGGEPHIYITGNCTDSLRKEVYLALSDKLREMAGGNKPSVPTLVM